MNQRVLPREPSTECWAVRLTTREICRHVALHDEPQHHGHDEVERQTLTQSRTWRNGEEKFKLLDERIYEEGYQGEASRLRVRIARHFDHLNALETTGLFTLKE